MQVACLTPFCAVNSPTKLFFVRYKVLKRVSGGGTPAGEVERFFEVPSFSQENQPLLYSERLFCTFKKQKK